MKESPIIRELKERIARQVAPPPVVADPPRQRAALTDADHFRRVMDDPSAWTSRRADNRSILPP